MKHWLHNTLPSIWQRHSLWHVLLLPLSMLYAIALCIKNLSYRLKLQTVTQSTVPVMVIGNITVGGTGKTPMVIHLVEILQQQGLKVGVISRGYGSLATKHNTQHCQLVSPHASASEVGDEPLLIVQATAVPMVIGANRSAAIAHLLTHTPYPLDLIMSDDGLQHTAMGRAIEWVIIDHARQLGNGLLLPAGPLRDYPSRLHNTTVVWHMPPIHADNSSSNKSPHISTTTTPFIRTHTHTSPPTPNFSMQLCPQPLQPINQPAEAPPPLAGDTIHAVAGIGNPQRFFNLLTQLGYQVIPHPMPDHHNYHVHDFDFISTKTTNTTPLSNTAANASSAAIITTAKDAVKIAPLAISAWSLPVKAQLSSALYAHLQQQLANLGIQVDLHDYI